MNMAFTVRMIADFIRRCGYGLFLSLPDDGTRRSGPKHITVFNVVPASRTLRERSRGYLDHDLMTNADARAASFGACPSSGQSTAT
jgi:hypothetical protein